MSLLICGSCGCIHGIYEACRPRRGDEMNDKEMSLAARLRSETITRIAYEIAETYPKEWEQAYKEGRLGEFIEKCFKDRFNVG